MSTTRKEGFSAEEKAAMKARARELKDKTDGESAVRAAIAKMAPADRAIGKRLHELVKAAAPDLSPKTWYGMPAYAKAGKVVCFFRDAGKFKERYAMLGFNDAAQLVKTEKVGRARRCTLVPYAFEGISTWLQRLERFAQVVERTKGAR